MSYVRAWSPRAHLQFDPLVHAVERPDGWMSAKGWKAICGARIKTWGEGSFLPPRARTCRKCATIVNAEEGLK